MTEGLSNRGHYAPTLDEGDVARVIYEPNEWHHEDPSSPLGWFRYQAHDKHGELIGKGGAENELYTLAQLVCISRFVIDWHCPAGQALRDTLNNETLEGLHPDTIRLLQYRAA